MKPEKGTSTARSSLNLKVLFQYDDDAQQRDHLQGEADLGGLRVHQQSHSEIQLPQQAL